MLKRPEEEVFFGGGVNRCLCGLLLQNAGVNTGPPAGLHQFDLK